MSKMLSKMNLISVVQQLPKEDIETIQGYVEMIEEENKRLKDKLSKIETLIINHNCDTGDIYYKYNSKFLKSELCDLQQIIKYLEEVNRKLRRKKKGKRCENDK